MSKDWTSIPSHKISDWRSVFGVSADGANVAGACPICGARQLHRFYQSGRALNRVSEGECFVARGACWEWCSNCRTYEHYSALVPEWWRSDLTVDESKLTASPDVLEAAVQRRAST
jgi:hypothetical protein